MFFSLFPMYFSDGSPSDGKAAELALRNKLEDRVTDDIFVKKMEDDDSCRKGNVQMAVLFCLLSVLGF